MQKSIKKNLHEINWVFMSANKNIKKILKIFDIKI